MKSKLFIACVIAMMLTVVGSRATANFDCYAADVIAKNEWHTVLWDQPGFSGRAIYMIETESDIRIVDSKQKSGKCWAQFEFVPDTATAVQHKFGWFVIDDRTLAEMPAYCDPKRDRDAAFDERIEKGMALLGEPSSYWHQYVKQYDYMIQPEEPGEVSSGASWPNRCVEIGTHALKSDTNLAYTLVHETCHIHQGFDGRWPDPEDAEARVRAEKECHAKALEMMWEIDPTHSQARLARWMLVQDDSWWRAFAMWTCLRTSEVESSMPAGQASDPALSFPDCMFAMYKSG